MQVQIGITSGHLNQINLSNRVLQNFIIFLLFKNHFLQSLYRVAASRHIWKHSPLVFRIRLAGTDLRVWVSPWTTRDWNCLADSLISAAEYAGDLVTSKFSSLARARY